jgi:hypothetical protein
MWTTRTEQLSTGRVLRFHIAGTSAPVPYSEALRLWQHDPGFRSFFLGLLTGAPFSAFRWETPPLTAASKSRPFEFVLLDSPGLAREPDPDAFADHFSGADVVSFANLGKDAVLVVPCPRGPAACYGHLAAFVREAPEEQKHQLWALVGEVMEQQLGRQPVWLSTAGAGVSWLHVRLDQRPKYYGFAPYRDARS